MSRLMLVGVGGGAVSVPPPATAILLADFDAEVGVYTDVGNTLALDSDPVQEWRSSVGGHVASQLVTAKKPTWRDLVIGSKKKPALHFAADDILHANSLASLFGGNDKAFSVVMVIRWNVIQDQDVLSIGVGTTFFPLISIRGGATSYGTSRTDPAQLNKSNTGGTSGYNTASQGHLWTTTFDGTVNNMWVDTVQVGATNQNLDVADMGTLTRAAIGGRQADAGDYKYADIYLAKLLIYDRALPTDERVAIEGALKARYGTP